MSRQTAIQLRAFELAHKLITISRAKEILRWKNWRHGGVLGGAPKPSCPDISDVEDQMIRRLWLTLNGSSCWMSALYMLRNDERPTSE
jgi:hypothetical protein